MKRLCYFYSLSEVLSTERATPIDLIWLAGILQHVGQQDTSTDTSGRKTGHRAIHRRRSATSRCVRRDTGAVLVDSHKGEASPFPQDAPLLGSAGKHQLRSLRKPNSCQYASG